MPVVREALSISQLAELLGIEAWRLIDVHVDLLRSTAQIVLRPETDDPSDLHPPMGESKWHKPAA